MGVLFVVIAIVVLWIFLFRHEIWSRFDHGSWDEDAQPSMDAFVVNVKSEKVKYSKNNAKFKTTVYFSDGFNFVTHLTDRKQHLISYDISVNTKEILQIAKEAHTKAVIKKLK